MDPDTNDLPDTGGGGGQSQSADAPDRALQPAAFLAALEAHRAQFGPSASLAVVVIRLDRFAHACDTVGARRAHGLRAQVKSRVASVAAMPVAMHWLGPADLGLACLLPEGAKPSLALSQAIAGVVARPYLVEGFEVFLSCSIGSAIDDPDTGAERHLQRAFDAMLRVNKRGGDGIHTAVRPATPRLATLLAALPGAIGRGEMSLQLQPRASLVSGDITAYTARLRWQHPVLGRVAPQDFLPAAEALGLMNEMGGWTLLQLLDVIESSGALGPLQFTLLATSSQLQADDTICMLRRAIEARGLPPGQICVEVPVDILPDASTTHDKVRRLREGGIGLALADFTDTDASRHGLDLTRPDMVMLDVRHLGSTNLSQAMAASLRAACCWAKQRGVAVCAKGVETQAQLEAVRAWGCDSVQGYLLAQPFPAMWLAQTHMAVAERARRMLAP
ncbi:EAL domain-containing protein [Cupriavidus agavae]|uniref:Diguanylate cyclase/phosphodiesterase n=1 Tax=Cupriavidus agavae TaxID=1001822 RepID=A0A4Q7RFS2_9BURK|nr:EAL domain-containing protein [Cupriavidus agavae]RZT31298.1 diguanylate cyclase/phosphodiesterase [Cupriavidus agavae]